MESPCIVEDTERGLESLSDYRSEIDDKEGKYYRTLMARKPDTGSARSILPGTIEDATKDYDDFNDRDG